MILPHYPLKTKKDKAEIGKCILLLTFSTYTNYQLMFHDRIHFFLSMKIGENIIHTVLYTNSERLKYCHKNDNR